LVIDDDQDILDLIEFILKEKGLDVIASVTDKMLKDVVHLTPDLILLDDWLQGIPGHELCIALKGDPTTKNIPVIIISATMGLGGIAEKCFADSYIEKPFDIENLERQILGLLNNVDYTNK
jgi:CheY-like chemotaxis protein